MFRSMGSTLYSVSTMTAGQNPNAETSTCSSRTVTALNPTSTGTMSAHEGQTGNRLNDADNGQHRSTQLARGTARIANGRLVATPSKSGRMVINR